MASSNAINFRFFKHFFFFFFFCFVFVFAFLLVSVFLACNRRCKPYKLLQVFTVIITKTYIDLPRVGTFFFDCFTVHKNTMQWIISALYHLWYIPCEAKNWKSGWLTWSRLSQFSATCMREFADWCLLTPFCVHIGPLNLYEAIPKIGIKIFGTSPNSLGSTMTGAWLFPLPAKTDKRSI